MFAKIGLTTPLTQKVTSNLNGWSQAGGRVLQCLTCVLRGNMFMTDGSFDESGQGSAVEHRSRPARAPYCVARGGAASVTGVRPIRASSIPVPGGSLPPRPAGRSHGGYGADHTQASAEHSTSVAEVCEKQWSDYRSDRDTRVERVSRCSKKAWLSRAQGAARFKSTSTMRLIACGSRNSPKPTIFWCPVGGRVKEFDDEDDGNLRAGLVRAAARGEHDREPDGVADRVRPGPRSGGAQRVGLRR